METSLNALRAIDTIRIGQRAMTKAAEVLASGQRVNSAADDASSLDIARVMTSQIRGLNQAVRNIHDGLSLTQTAEASLVVIGDALQRMRELAVQAATGTLSDAQKSLLDAEYQELKNQVAATVKMAQWNGFRLLQELSPTTFQIQAGADANQLIPINIPKVYADGTMVGFTNGDFEASPVGVIGSPNALNGWTIGNSRVILSGATTTNIGGWPAPLDTTVPAGSPGDQANMSAGTFSSSITSNVNDPARGAKSLGLVSSSVTVDSKGIVRGPYVISNDAVQIAAGASVSFDWKASSGGDAFDVYAYLLNVDTGATVKLLDQTGTQAGVGTNWATVTTTVPAAGNYKFVFVSGTFDASGGTKAGSTLYIDNIVAPPVVTVALNSTAVSSVANAHAAMAQIDRDLVQVLAARASLGATLHRLTHAADNLVVYSTNKTSSRSTLMDLDYAAATSEMAKLQAVNTAATLTLKQASENQQHFVSMVQSNSSLFKT
jgi:flagellin